MRGEKALLLNFCSILDHKLIEVKDDSSVDEIFESIAEKIMEHVDLFAPEEFERASKQKILDN